MSTDTLVCRDIYMRHTDKKGNTYVQEHRVWDAERFLAARAADAAKEGGKARAEQITEEQYRTERTR